MQKNRVFLWDNLRFLLILFVVVGHFITQSLDSPDFKSLWIFIYSFHMPLFVFISGIFHKNTRITHKVVSFVAIGMMYKIIVFIARSLVGHKPEFRIFWEAGAPWYMFALAAFVLITYLLRNQNLKVILVLWLVVACFAGYDSNINQGFSLSRIIVFYPFYLMGTLCSKETLLNLAKKKSIKLTAFLVIAVWAALCLVFEEKLWPLNSLFAGENPFNQHFYDMGFFWRLLCFAISTPLCFAFIFIMPTRRLPIISEVGTRTLQIYFWHRAPLYFIREYGLTALLCATALGKVAYLLLALALTLVCALKIFSFPTAHIIKYTAPKTDNQ